MHTESEEGIMFENSSKFIALESLSLEQAPTYCYIVQKIQKMGYCYLSGSLQILLLLLLLLLLYCKLYSACLKLSQSPSIPAQSHTKANQRRNSPIFLLSVIHGGLRSNKFTSDRSQNDSMSNRSRVYLQQMLINVN